MDPVRTCEFAHKSDNISKNRFENAVPFDHCRVVLSIVVGSVADTTYINASLVKVCLWHLLLHGLDLDMNIQEQFILFV